MTALNQYQRLEGTALWRASPDDQRREVIVSLGDATIVITDMSDRALAHWSIAAVERANPGGTPAVYHPDGDPGETLEFTEDASDMVAAIEKLRQAIARRRPKPGRLRLYSFLTILAGIGALGVFWLPEALVKHTLSVVPLSKRVSLGEEIVKEMRRFTGPKCSESAAYPALSRLADRLPDLDGQPQTLLVFSSGINGVRALPGNTMLIDSRLIQNEDGPDVLAGNMLAAYVAKGKKRPLETLLEGVGIVSTFRLLTTGSLPAEDIRKEAEALLAAPAAPLDTEALIETFKRYDIRSTPFAEWLPQSEPARNTLTIKEPFPDTAPTPILEDADWVRLQGICGG